MNITTLSALIFVCSLGAGFLGSLTGLGGGVVIVPLLTLVFGVDIRYAIGASLISVIATSSGAAAAYVREGYSNVRIGLFLEIATSAGALMGAALATHVSSSAIAIVFGLVLLYSAISASAEPLADQPHGAPEGRSLGERLRLNGSFPGEAGVESYTLRRVPLGFAIMTGAGALSGLLGIGSGAVKVLAMDRAMGLPFKVSTTTSNFMIGVTAAASAGVYLSRGYIDPGLAMPVMLGVLGGAMLGSRFLIRAEVSLLRNVFRAVLLVLAAEMIYNGWTKRILQSMHLDDNKMELIMGRLLQTGVLAAGVLMLAGGAYYLVLHGAQKPDYRTFHAVIPVRGEMIMWAAVVVMIATPVLRVAFAAVAFALERDWLYTGISLIVLSLLAYGLFG